MCRTEPLFNVQIWYKLDLVTAFLLGLGYVRVEVLNQSILRPVAKSPSVCIP